MWRDSKTQTMMLLRDRKQAGTIERRRFLVLIAGVLAVTFSVTSMVVWNFASPLAENDQSFGNSGFQYSDHLPIHQLNPA